MVVVLPAPFGSITPNTHPAATVKSTPCRTSRRPKLLVRDCTELATDMGPPGCARRRCCTPRVGAGRAGVYGPAHVIPDHAGSEQPAAHRDARAHRAYRGFMATLDITGEQFASTIEGNDIVLVYLGPNGAARASSSVGTVFVVSEKHPDVLFTRWTPRLSSSSAAEAGISSIPDPDGVPRRCSSSPSPVP